MPATKISENNLELVLKNIIRLLYNCSMKKICVNFEDEQAEHLTQMSHKLSLERNENLTLSDLVREALEQVYPIKKATKPNK